MSTQQNRKVMNIMNGNLKYDNKHLLSRQQELLSLIQISIRQQKKLSQLKQHLLDEYDKAKLLKLKEQNKKQLKYTQLVIETDEIRKKIHESDCVLINLEQEYESCLREYQQVIGEVSNLAQRNKTLQDQIYQETDKKSTLQTVTFDYQRLQNILHEEQKYFKSLSQQQQKSHEQRMIELNSIKEKLTYQQQNTTQQSIKKQYQIALIKITHVLKRKIEKNTSYFINSFQKFQRLTDLGIIKFKSCLKIATSHYDKQLKDTFRKWNKNVFSSAFHNNIVEKSLDLNVQSKRKIIALSKIVQRLNSDNLSLLHLYERTKIICLTSSTFQKKGKHIAFNKWKNNAIFLTKVQYRVKRLIQVLRSICVRNSFNEIKKRQFLLKRFEVVSHLISKHENMTKMGWAMRRWRWQTKNRQIEIMKSFIEKRQKFILISQRVKYQKRKSKAITSLQLLITKIQLKNYFSRYYQNIKTLKITSISTQIQTLRQNCAQSRKQNKSIKNDLTLKYSKLSINIFLTLFNNLICKDAFQIIKSTVDKQILKKQILMLVMTRKQVKSKFLALNELRKNVQFYQKKQMHQVLTDLNRKMQTINEKSSNFRQSLKKTIQQLGVHSSNKINQVMLYATGCQQKSFFNEYLKKQVQNKFKLILCSKSVQILSTYAKNNAFKAIYSNWKVQNKTRILIEKEKLFLKRKQTQIVSKVFNSLLQQLNRHKRAFSKLIHIQNVMYFYRLQSSFLSIKKKSHQQTLKIEEKLAQQSQKLLHNKSQNLQSLKNSSKTLSQKLTKLFTNFVDFQQISQRNKQNNFQQNQKQKYFNIYRNKVQQIKHSQRSLSFFFKFIELKNYSIFWKSCLTLLYEGQQAGLKEQLGKINKKNKTFQQKIIKTKTDIERNLHEKQEAHQLKQKQSNYCLQKYESNLTFFNKKFKKIEQNLYTKEVFKVWKKQSFGCQRIIKALQKILTKKNIIEPCERLHQYLKDFESQFKGQLVSISLLQRKNKIQIKDAFNLWRYGIKKNYTEVLKYKIDHIDQHHDQIQNDALVKRQQYANQVIRNKYFNLKVNIFMAFKNYWIQSKQINNKISPLMTKSQHNRKTNVLNCWKWLIFYKKTKRSFLSFKKQNCESNLKREVFDSLKKYRQQVYDLGFLSENLIAGLSFNLKKQAFNKLINFASFQKGNLIYERKRALNCLLMKKISKEKNIKMTVMWKWQSQLIPRKHYLCNILKSIQLRTIKSAFSKINQKKYWNQFYIKDIAEKVTTEGYSDVNSITNILMKQGFDPDELKAYLQKKNLKDQKVIQQVVGHLKVWPTKPMMIQAFHSWKEYVKIRKNAKKSLSKVFNFSSGLGRYFDRWRKKDPVFNEILQRQSRQNMLQRYYDLERLMKQYKRDIGNSIQNCQQLQQINNQYAKSTKMTVEIAFSNLANSVSKGMKQGFQLWRVKAKQRKILQTNVKYDHIVEGIQMLDEQKRNIRQKIKLLQNENVQLKQKCKWGQQCGQLLKKLMVQKDGLSINLAEKQHNLKILLEDNLRLKQKIKMAQSSALNLISKIKVKEDFQN